MGITVDKLRKTFGAHTALDGISFEVPENAFFCVVGPSGCGK
jgi:ABC-type Fe3+/spermidine/putrescine transport system ATPase subunit